jgi:phage shock protein E
MKRVRLSVVLALSFGLVLIGGGVASAYHSYVLTVQQLMNGLQKSSNPPDKGFILIDVRTPDEHLTGVIPGTDMNLDFREIGRRHQEIGAQLEDHIVVYCQSGQRSNVAAEILADLGYKHVYNVEGSMNAWVASGYPLAHPGG